MLKQRVLTAVVLLIVLLGSLMWSPIAFGVVAAAAIGATLFEWLRLAAWPVSAALVGGTILGAAMLGYVTLQPPAMSAPLVLLSAAVSFGWIVIGVALLRSDDGRIPMPTAASSLLAFVLLGSAGLGLLHFLQQGPATLLSVLAIVWIADIAAYFFGRAFGKRKLAPQISPGKTWAGAVGAAASVAVIALLAWRLWPTPAIFTTRVLLALPIAAALVALLALVAFSIVGDLFESFLKRRVGAKDSGTLLPGHGGVFDRIDAMVPVLPAAVVLEWLLRA